MSHRIVSFLFIFKPILFSILRIWFRLFPKGFVYFGHGISDARQDSFIERIHFPVDQLEDVIIFWKRMGFSFISMNELKIIANNGFKSSKPWIHFTFDDGYRNNLTVALPVFEKHKVPFTVFVSTDQVQSARRFDTFIIRAAIYHTKHEVIMPYVSYVLRANAGREERISYIRMVSSTFKQLNAEESYKFVKAASYLLSQDEWHELYNIYPNDVPISEEELVQLSQNSLVCIGSHGVSHAIHNEKHLNRQCIHEVEDSKIWLEHIIGKPVDVFAFPNGGTGDFSQNCIQNCRNAGYQLVFTTLKEPINKRTSALSIPRLFLSGDNQGAIRWLMKN